MSKNFANHPRKSDQSHDGIAKILVHGYKSLAEDPGPYKVEVRPLTLLAGANSSGKSSVVQPLLLLKQTLEAGFDPGPLLLHGSHLRFTSTRQVFPVGAKSRHPLTIGVMLEDASGFASYFMRKSDKEIELDRMLVADGTGKTVELAVGMTTAEIVKLLRDRSAIAPPDMADVRIERRRCFLSIRLGSKEPQVGFVERLWLDLSSAWLNPLAEVSLRSIIHVPGLRGNPERSYQTTAVGPMFPGTFETYVASVIHHWQEDESQELEELWSNLEQLGLTWKVQSRQVDAAQVELKVGRLPRARRGGARDLVNIADVGFGVSQTLPVLVALLAARPGQLVYLEQPEIHLHPKAQVALAEILARAAARGVRVVAETHSSLLLLAVQSLVAERKFASDKVILHWFERDEEGITRISPAELDEQGAYGDWPEDFAEVELEAQNRYMNAVEQRLFRAAGAKGRA